MFKHDDIGRATVYRIIQNGAVIATVDRLQYIRNQRNGVVINCAEAAAQGIYVNDACYHLPWLPALIGAAGEVTVEEFDGGATIAALDAAVVELEYANVLLELGVVAGSEA